MDYGSSQSRIPWQHEVATVESFSATNRGDRMNDPDYDADMAYEIMREDEALRLEESLKNLFKAFYQESPYYKGREEVLKNHMKNAIDWFEVTE